MNEIRFIVIDKKTNKEADIVKIAETEDWAYGLMTCDMDGFYIGEYGGLILCDECGQTACCPPDRFEVKFLDEQEGESNDTGQSN